MENKAIVAYPYRWVVLSVFMIIIAANQLLWITFAPVTSEAMRYLHVSDLQVGLLSMSFMVVFILLSIPASWIIDRYGIRLVWYWSPVDGHFRLDAGMISTDYTSVLLSQIGIAAGQPFLLNAITRWLRGGFPSMNGPGAGLGTLSMYVGIFAGMVVTPYLVNELRHGRSAVLLWHSVCRLGRCVVLVVRKIHAHLSSRSGRTVASFGWHETHFQVKDFNLLLIIFFIGLGIFNCVTTWIENILIPRGFTAVEAGMTGGVMIFSGILGAFVMPTISDRLRKRKPFIILALIGAALGLAGICFATSDWLLMFSAVLLGFFLLSSGPIGFQYGAEVTYPISEGTSNGFLLLMGQISGIAMIVLMDMFKDPVTGSMTKPMLALLGLMVVAVLISFLLKESKLISDEGDR